MNVQIKSSEVLILLAASVMSFIANLPDSAVSNIVDRKALLVALTALIVVAMFRYLQVFLLLTISILAIGANIPAELASQVGISQFALLVSLGVLITITLLNRVLGLLPTEREETPTKSIDWQEVMLAAIAKGDLATLHRLLVNHVSVNFTVNGMTPLHLAAEKGYPELVRLLIGYGADFRIKNAEGKTALEVAQAKKKFVKTEDILFNAAKGQLPVFGQAETRRMDAEIWQDAR